MKPTLRSIALLMWLLALTGCAGMEYRSANVAGQSVSSRVTKDEAYVARVEAAARQRGVEVLWVNAPASSNHSSENPQ